MADQSSIEWTDATWNPVRGCDKVSPGCKHCYAETFAERWRGIKGHPFEQGFDLRLVPEALDKPLRWKKPRKIFVNSMSDLFHEDIPNEYIAAVFGVMAACPQHTFQVLTKRAERLPKWFEWAEAEGRELMWSVGETPPGGSPVPAACAMAVGSVASHGIELSEEVLGKDGWRAAMKAPWPLPNVHLGVSCEDQQRAEERIPHLLRTPAAVRFVSAEPLLGPLSLADLYDGAGGIIKPLVGLHWEPTPKGLTVKKPRGAKLDWVIVGSESGPRARPMEIEWARKIVDDCRAASVAVFVKQIANANDRKGGDPQFWPPGDWPRQFPEAPRG